jgi:hypothetical protein
VQDFGADLKADLLLENADGRVKIMFLNGSAITGELALRAAGSGWTVRGVSRNGGISYIYWGHTDGRQEFSWVSGTVLDTQPVQPPQAWMPTLTAAMNNSGGAEVLRLNPDGSMQAFSGYAIEPGSPYALLRLADFNNDGMSDILAQHPDGSVAMRLAHGYGWGNWITVLQPGTGWSPYFIDDDWSEWIARH